MPGLRSETACIAWPFGAFRTPKRPVLRAFRRRGVVLSNLRQMTDKTVLIVTHRPAALSIADRTVALVPPQDA